MVNVTLPDDDIWYNYFSKEIEQNYSSTFKKELTLKEMLLYVRGGTIMPIKLHNRRLSLIRAFFMPLKLDIYPDPLNKASGSLFFDDGLSFSYQTDQQYLLLTYTFNDNVLSFTPNSNRTFVEEAYYIQIEQVSIYNVRRGRCPIAVLERGHYHESFECKDGRLEIRDLEIPLDGEIR